MHIQQTLTMNELSGDMNNRNSSNWS